VSSVVAWVGVDSRGPASFYLASDSRISWRNKTRWDFGRKVFATTRSADLFGYCGDVLFPTLVLGQACALADAGLLWREQDSAEERHLKLRELVEKALLTYPHSERQEMTFLHASREGHGMTGRFVLWETKWTPADQWRDRELPQPEKSALVLAVGSGHSVVERWNEEWTNALDRTSRSVFSSFCDALDSEADGFSGGAPQLVGLYRERPARSFGILYKGERYFQGLPIAELADFSSVEWRNCLFEVCDGITMKRRHDAQPQPRPSGLRQP
jgi:hypothetical protein